MKRRILPHRAVLPAILFFLSVLFIFVGARFIHAAPLPDTCKRMASSPVHELPLNPYESLSVPTQITKIGNDYFIVDCYHNQILTSTSLDRPLTEWYVMTDRINRGHTIAGNAKVYLADDTENNRILVFQKRDGGFVLTQTFENIGIRPHYIVYDNETMCFYALSSMTGELYVFAQSGRDSLVRLKKILRIPELDGIYVRSFTIDEDVIYFPACNGQILEARKDDLEILNCYPVPDEVAGMVQLYKTEDSFLLTVSTDIYGNADFATILQFTSLSGLADGLFYDINPLFTKGGTPYYVTAIDEQLYLTQHCPIPGTGVWQFRLQGEDVTDLITLHP